MRRKHRLPPISDVGCDEFAEGAKSGSLWQDAKGRFVKSNRAGPGGRLGYNKFRIDKIKHAMAACITLADAVAVMRTVLAAAKEGDLGAAKLLFDWLGKLPQDESAPGIIVLNKIELETVPRVGFIRGNGDN